MKYRESAINIGISIFVRFGMPYIFANFNYMSTLVSMFLCYCNMIVFCFILANSAQGVEG